MATYYGVLRAEGKDKLHRTASRRAVRTHMDSDGTAGAQRL
jgi:hypothetical protein